MSKAFNLTAEINLRGPANLKAIVSQIRRELGTVTGDIKLNVSAKSAKGIDVINKKLNVLNTTLVTARQNTADLNVSLQQLGASLSNISGNTVSVDKNLSRTAASTATAAKNLNEASTAMEKFGKQSALAVKRFAAFSIVSVGIYSLINAINSGFKAFIEFDKQLIRLQQVTGQGAIGLRGLEQEITNLSITLGVASEDLANVAVTLAQAGISANDTRIALAALAKTELAPSFENLTKTTEGAIAAIRQFGLETSELEAALGSINAVAAAFAVESGDIIAAIQRTGGVFASASRGVTEGADALNEFIAVFTSVRATTRESAETIATGLRTIFTRIQRADTINQLREFGIELTDLEGKFVGPFEAIRRLSEGLRGLDPRDLRFSTIVEELGGFRQIGKVLPLIQQNETALKALSVAQKGQNSLTDAQAIAQKSLAVQLAQVRNQFVALIRDVGKSTAFQTLFKFVIGLSKGLLTLANAFKPILPILGIIGAFKGAKALTQFAGGFFGSLKNAGGPKGVGANIGGAVGGAKDRERADTTAKAAAAVRDNTTALQTLTTAVQDLESAIRNRPTFSGGGKVLGFNRGGTVPGSGRGDKVPAMLEPKEFVMSRKGVETVGRQNLEKLNRGGKIGRFAKGGYTVQLDYPEFGSFDDSEMSKGVADIISETTRQFTPRGGKKTLSQAQAQKSLGNNWNAVKGSIYETAVRLVGAGEPSAKGDFDYKSWPGNIRGFNSIKQGTPTDAKISTNAAKRSGEFTKKIANYKINDISDGRREFGAAVFEPSGKDEVLRIQEADVNKLMADRKSIGGLVQKFARGGVVLGSGKGDKIQRNLGYIDYDVIANEANAGIVEEAMKKSGVKGPRLYAEYLTDLAVKARKEQKLDKLRAIYGVAGSGKTTLARGQGTDVGTLRETTRFPILTPEDIDKASEVLILTSSVSRDKLEGFLSEVDRAYTISSTTATEQERIKAQRASRDVTGIGLEGRTPGTTTGVSRDTAVGEALLGDALGNRSVVLGRSESGKLRQKKGNELVEIIKKRIGFTWGGFAPTTKGHESIVDSAAAYGIPPEDFIALVGANEGITDPKNFRTAILDQDARVLLAKAGFGAKGATVLPKPRDFEVPQGFDVGVGSSGRRQVVLPAAGSTAFMADKTEKDFQKYIAAGYKTVNLPRSEGISGTQVRELIADGDMAGLQEVLSPGVYEMISRNIGRIQNRAGVLPNIIAEVEQSKASSLEQIEQQIKAIGIARISNKKVATDPEYAAKVEVLKELRAKRDKIKGAAEFEPYRLLAKLAAAQPDKYGLDFTQSPAPNLASMTGVESVRSPAVAKNMGGLIQNFMAGGRAKKVRKTRASMTMAGSKLISEIGGIVPAIDLLKAKGFDLGRDEIGGTTTILRSNKDAKQVLIDAINAKYAEFFGGVAEQGLSFGAVAMQGNEYTNQAKEISNGLKQPTTVSITGRLISDKFRQMLSEDISGGYQSAIVQPAQRLTIAQILEDIIGGDRLISDFDKVINYGADIIPSSPGAPMFSEFSDLDKVREALGSSRLSPFGESLVDLVKSTNSGELLNRMFINTARSQVTAPLIKEWLDSVGLPIPLENIYGVGGANVSGSSIPRLKAAIVQTLGGGTFVDDDPANVGAVDEAMRSAGLGGKSYLMPFEATAGSEVNTAKGVLFQNILANLGAFRNPDKQSIDFPNGLGSQAAGLVNDGGMFVTMPTDAKYTLSGPSDLVSNITNYLKAQGYMAGGVVKPAKKTFGTGEFPFPRRISNAYFREIEKVLEDQRIKDVWDRNPKNERIIPDADVVQAEYDKPFDKGMFLTSFKDRISKDTLFQRMGQFARFIGLPSEDLSAVLPQQIDFGAPGMLGGALFSADPTGYRTRGLQKVDLSQYGFTEQDQQDVFGYGKLLEEKQKALKKVLKTPVRTFEDGSFQYDYEAARSLWAEENDLKTKISEKAKIQRDASEKAKAARMRIAETTGRGGISIDSDTFSGNTQKYDVLYHELTHQLFQSMRVRNAESFDKYKQRVTSLFEGDNDDLAEAFDSLAQYGYKSADVVYGRSYKQKTLQGMMLSIYRKAEDSRSEADKNYATEMAKGISASEKATSAKAYRPINPTINDLLVRGNISQESIDKMEDNGKEEFLTTLVQNAPKLDANLSGILDSTLTSLLGDAGIQRLFFGGKVDPLAKKYGLTQKEFLKVKNIADAMGLDATGLEEKLKQAASRKQKGRDIKFGLLDTQAEFMASSSMVSQEQAALEEFLKANKLAAGGKIRLYHGSTTGTNDATLKSFKEKGALADIAQGYGQGAGFYVFSGKEIAKKQAMDRAKKGLGSFTVFSGDTEGKPMVLTFEEILDPATWDLDYELNKGSIVKWLYDNYDSVKDVLAPQQGVAGIKGLISPGEDPKTGEYIMTKGLRVQSAQGSRKSLYSGTSSDLREGEILGQIMGRLQQANPDFVAQFENQFFKSKALASGDWDNLALKYVGSSPLIPTNIETFADGGLVPGSIILSNRGNIQAKWAPGLDKQGEVNASKTTSGLFEVTSAAATGGMGRSLYDVVMEAATSQGSSLISDRKRVSGSALNVWNAYFEKNAGQDKQPVSKYPLGVEDFYLGNLFNPEDYPNEASDPSTWKGEVRALQYAYKKSASRINSPYVINKETEALRSGGFASGGTVPAMVSNGEAFVPPKLAKRIGYAKLDRMNQADRNGMRGFASGGISTFKGPGSGTSDSIGPVGLPEGGYVIRAKATKALGLNKGGYVGIKKFTTGGVLTADERELVAARAKSKGVSFNAELAQIRKAFMDMAKGIMDVQPKKDALRIAAIENRERLKSIKSKAAAEKAAIDADPTLDPTEKKKQKQQIDRSAAREIDGIKDIFAAKIKEIDPRLDTSSIDNAAKNLTGNLLNTSDSLDEIIGRSSVLTGVFDTNISAVEAQTLAAEQLAESTGIASSSLEALVPATEVATERLRDEQEETFGELGRLFPELTRAFQESGPGSQLVDLADQFSMDSVSTMLDTRLSSLLGPSLGSGIASKLSSVIDGLGGPISAAAAAVSVIGSTLPQIGDVIDDAFGTELGDSPAFAGLAGGIEGAGQYGASGAVLGAQVGGPIGALVGGISGAVYGAIKGSITASLTKELENSLGDLTESVAAADKAMQDLAEQNTFANIDAAQLAVGEQLQNAKNLEKFAAPKTINERFNPFTEGFYLSAEQQAEALSSQQQTMTKVLEQNIELARTVAERFDDTQLDIATQVAESASPQDFAKNSVIIDTYTRALLKQRGANIAASESIEDFMKELDASGKATVEAAKQEAQIDAARAAYINNRRQLGDSEEEARKKLTKGGQKALDEGLKLVQQREEEILKAIRLARAVQKATAAQERLLDIYRRMTASIDKLAKDMDKVIARTEAFSDAASGSGRVRQMDTGVLDVLENITAYSMDEVRSAGSDVAALLGNTPEAQELGNTAVAAKIIQDRLPAILSETSGKDVDAVIGTLETQLEDLIGKGAIDPTTGRGANEQIIQDALGEVRDKLSAQGDEKTFEQLSRDANFLSQISDSVRAGLETQQKVVKAYIEGMNKVIDSTNKIVEALTRADEYFIKAAQIRIDSEIQLKETLGQRVSLGERNRGFENEIRSLTRNIVPGGTLDPNAIGAFARASSATLAQDMPGISGQTTQQQVDSMKAEAISRQKVAKANNDAVTALKKLAEDGSRAANALALIKENQQLAANSSEFLRKALTSNAEELADMTVDVQAYTMAMSGTASPTQFQDLGFRQQVFRGADMVGQMLPEDLRNRINAGLQIQMLEATNPDLLNQTAYRGRDATGKLTTISYREALEQQASGAPDSQTQALIDEYERATQTQIDANRQLGALQLAVASRLDTDRNTLLQKILDKFNDLVGAAKDQVAADAEAGRVAAVPTTPEDRNPRTEAATVGGAAPIDTERGWSRTAILAAGGLGVAGSTEIGQSLGRAAYDSVRQRLPFGLGGTPATPAGSVPRGSGVMGAFSRGYQAGAGRGAASIGGTMGDAARRTARGTLAGRVGYYAGRVAQSNPVQYVSNQVRAASIQTQRLGLRAAQSAPGQFLANQGRAALIQGQRLGLRAAPALTTASQGVRTAAGYAAQGARGAAGYAGNIINTARQAVPSSIGLGAPTAQLGRVIPGLPTVPTRGPVGVRGGLLGTAALLGTDAVVGAMGGAEAVFGREGTASRETYDTTRNLAGAGLVASTGGAGVAINTAVDAFVTAGELIYDPAKKLNQLYSDTTAIDTLNQKIEAFGPITGTIVGSLDNAASGFMRPIDTIGKGIAQTGGLLIDSFNAVISSFSAGAAEARARETINEADKGRYGEGAASALESLDFVEQNRAKDEARITAQLEALQSYQASGGDLEGARALGISTSAEGRFSNIQEEIDFQTANLAGLAAERKQLREKEKDYTLDFSSNDDTEQFRQAVQQLADGMRREIEARIAEQKNLQATTTTSQAASSTTSESTSDAQTSAATEVATATTPTSTSDEILTGDENAGAAAGRRAWEQYMADVAAHNAALIQATEDNTQALIDSATASSILATTIPNIGTDLSFGDELAPFGPNGEQSTYKELLDEIISKRSSDNKPQKSAAPKPLENPVPKPYSGVDFAKEQQEVIMEAARTGESQVRGYDLRDPATVSPAGGQTQAAFTNQVLPSTDVVLSRLEELFSNSNISDPELIQQILSDLISEIDPSVSGSAVQYLNPNQILDILSKSSPDQLSQLQSRLDQLVPSQTQFNSAISANAPQKPSEQQLYVAKKQELTKAQEELAAQAMIEGSAERGFDLRAPEESEEDCCDRIVAVLEQILNTLISNAEKTNSVFGGVFDSIIKTLTDFANNPIGALTSAGQYVAGAASGTAYNLTGGMLGTSFAEQRATAAINANNQERFGVDAGNSLNQLSLQEQIQARDEAKYRQDIAELERIRSSAGSDEAAIEQARQQGLISSDYSGDYDTLIDNKYAQLNSMQGSSNPAYRQAVNQLAYGSDYQQNAPQAPSQQGYSGVASMAGMGSGFIGNLPNSSLLGAAGNGLASLGGQSGGVMSPSSLISSPIAMTNSLPAMIGELTSGIKTAITSSFTELLNSRNSGETTVAQASAANNGNILSVDEKTTQFLQGLKDSLDGFGSYVGTLAEAAAKLPDKIEFNGNYKFSVNITGAEAFERMKVDLKDEITGIFQPQIDEISKQTLGGLGRSPALRSRTNN